MLSIFLMLLTLEMNPEPWQTINDGVMGGRSSGGITRSESGLSFKGELSLENNGGFASVRRLVEADLSSAKGLQLQVRGDGRTYQVRLRQDGNYDGVAWRAEFSTTTEWQTVSLDFEAFEPVFRGRQVPGAGPVVASNISQLGFMLADKTPGPFLLDIKSIRFL